jgi:hypothetical protein
MPSKIAGFKLLVDSDTGVLAMGRQGLMVELLSYETYGGAGEPRTGWRDIAPKLTTKGSVKKVIRLINALERRSDEKQDWNEFVSSVW